MAASPWELNKQAFGLVVARARDTLELSLEEFAGRAGISRRTLINIEHGQGNPQLNSLHGIVHVVEAAGVSILDLWAAVCEGHQPAGLPKSDCEASK